MSVSQTPGGRPTGPCALCLNTAPLCNSHIIPEFLFKALYDAKHRFHEVAISVDRERLLQKGMREHLLCDACEEKLSAWETYARGVLVGGVPLSFSREGNVIWVSGIDYPRFKLFEMSILWRAGVARSEFFTKVHLGPHQGRLRQMLLAADPGPPWLYGCFLAGTKIGGRPSTGLMIAPGPIRLGDVNGMRFVFGGFTWGFLVSGHKPLAAVLNTILHPNGRLPLIVGDLEQAPFFQEMMARRRRSADRGS